MPTQTSDEAQLRDRVVGFNGLLAAARNMVMRLVQGQGKGITTATTVPEITAFQELFNANRAIMFEEIDAMTDGKFVPAQLALELKKKGLTTDGKYGPRTSTALALTMWARSGEPQLINEIGMEAVPSNPSTFTQFYLKKKDLYDRTLAQMPEPQGAPNYPQAEEPAQQVVQPAQEGGISPTQHAGTSPVVATPAPTPSNLDFSQTPTLVRGQGKGKMSFATMLSLGIGAAVLGGILVWQLKKRKVF